MSDLKTTRAIELKKLWGVDVQELENLLARDPPVAWIMPRERDILARYFGLRTNEPHTQGSIGAALCISRSRVGHVINNVMPFIRDDLGTVPTISRDPDMLCIEVFGYDLGAVAGIHRTVVRETRESLRDFTVRDLQEKTRAELLSHRRVRSRTLNAAFKMLLARGWSIESEA